MTNATIVSQHYIQDSPGRKLLRYRVQDTEIPGAKMLGAKMLGAKMLGAKTASTTIKSGGFIT
jgi:hypothetical protein